MLDRCTNNLNNTHFTTHQPHTHGRGASNTQQRATTQRRCQTDRDPDPLDVTTRLASAERSCVSQASQAKRVHSGRQRNAQCVNTPLDAHAIGAHRPSHVGMREFSVYVMRCAEERCGGARVGGCKWSRPLAHALACMHACVCVHRKAFEESSLAHVYKGKGEVDTERTHVERMCAAWRACDTIGAPNRPTKFHNMIHRI